jgi:tripartite-type tricarboxylate transporter receptor subunit TctC
MRVGGGRAVREAARLLLLLSFTALVSAQDYPVKPVRIVIGFPPGGPNELAARPVAQKLHELLGQPFVLDHRPGANSIIATVLVA